MFTGRVGRLRSIFKVFFVLFIISAMLLVPYQQSYGRIQNLKINEIEINPPGPVAHKQWIEIYNMGEDLLNISGWLLKSTKLGKTFPIPPGYVIRGHDYVIVPLPSVTLGQENESIVLLTQDSVEVDRTPTFSDIFDDDRTWQRFPNGVDTNTETDWLFTNSTHGKSNGVPVVKQNFRMSTPLFVDQVGNNVQSFISGKMAGVRSEIINEFNEERSFTYIIKITDENDVTVFLSWVEELIIPTNRVIKPTIFWLAQAQGVFKVETFVWRSFALPEPLTPQQAGLLRVAG